MELKKSEIKLLRTVDDKIKDNHAIVSLNASEKKIVSSLKRRGLIENDVIRGSVMVTALGAKEIGRKALTRIQRCARLRKLGAVLPSICTKRGNQVSLTEAGIFKSTKKKSTKKKSTKKKSTKKKSTKKKSTKKKATKKKSTKKKATKKKATKKKATKRRPAKKVAKRRTAKKKSTKKVAKRRTGAVAKRTRSGGISRVKATRAVRTQCAKLLGARGGYQTAIKKGHRTLAQISRPRASGQKSTTQIIQAVLDGVKI